MQVHGVRTACALRVCTAVCAPYTGCALCTCARVQAHLAANPHLEVYNRQERPPSPSCPPEPPS